MNNGEQKMVPATSKVTSANILNSRKQEFPEPIHFATCHTLSKVSLFTPFPHEEESSLKLQCFDAEQSRAIVNNPNCDAKMSEYLAVLLSDISEELAEIVLKQNEEENNQSDVVIPPLMQSIQQINNYSLSTSLNFVESFENGDIIQTPLHVIDETKEVENLSAPSVSHDLIENMSCTVSNKRRPEVDNLPSAKHRKMEKFPNLPTVANLNRPSTPPDVLQQREAQWNELQRQRAEKYMRRQAFQSLNNDEMAENESFAKFSSLLNLLLDRFENISFIDSSEVPAELLLDPYQLDELKNEAHKLKSWRKLNKINADKLVKLLIILERNIKDVLDDDGALTVKLHSDNDEDEAAIDEFAYERIIRSINSASFVLTIVTSSKMPKQILMDSAIERSYQICKQCLDVIIYPSLSPRTQSKSKKANFDGGTLKRKRLESKRTLPIYQIIVEIVRSFSELARYHSLNETLMVNLSSLSTPTFFADVPELQIGSTILLPIIFSKCVFLRKNIMFDILNSLHRLPTSRTQRNCYRLNNSDMIGNFTVLILQLIQSIVQIPSKKNAHLEFEEQNQPISSEFDEQIILNSYDDSKKLSAYFFSGFLNKCTAKSEDDYRKLFDLFLQDLLISLYRPEWPAAELLLTMLANILVKNIMDKAKDLSLRVASLDFLGTITARLRKERISAVSNANSAFEKGRLDSVVKNIMHDECNDSSISVDDIDISHLSSTDKVRKLEQALIDYIIGTKCVGIGVSFDTFGSLVGDGDVFVEYILNFYIVEWFRETVLDVELMKERYKQATSKNLTAKDAQKYDRKIERIVEKGNNMKEFILGLIDKRYLRKRMQIIARTGNIFVDSDANWVVRYLASKKELTQSFELYLDKILKCFGMEFPVHVRAKAMKCLAQLVEADHTVLMMPEVNKIVQERLIDASASVREATFDTIGKFLVSRPDLLSVYYPILINRIRDAAVAVRKRVIKILRDIIRDQPYYENRAEILSEIVQRVNDEESVKKLCVEIFQQLWFQPLKESEKALQHNKVDTIIDTTVICVKEAFESLETLLNHIIKSPDSTIISATSQIINSMVDTAITLDSKAANNNTSITDPNRIDSTPTNSEDPNQARLLACLTALSLFAKVRPELLIQHIEIFVPYLSISVSSMVENRVLNQLILMLERVVPLIEHPLESLLRQIDDRLNDIVKDGGMVLIASSISCMSSVHKKFKKFLPGICSTFTTYLKYLERLKVEMESNVNYELDQERKPIALRSIYTIGLMCRYFNFDKILEIQNSPSREITMDSKNGEEPDLGPLHNLAFSLLFFFARNRDSAICQKAIISLGHFSAGFSCILTKAEVKQMFMILLNTEKTDYFPLKVQVLKNLSYFLHADEERALKHVEEIKTIREEHQDQINLKDMELSSSGLSSTIIQQYWTAILNCYFHIDHTVRLSSAQVIWQTLEQGLVTPGPSIPTLVSMSTDPISSIRLRTELVIKDMNTKYKGMIISKAITGVRMSYQLQKKICDKKMLIRGIRMADNPLERRSSSTSLATLPRMSSDAQALLSNFYTGIRSNRQQRRHFFFSLLRLFSEDTKERIDVDEWIYLSDNIAHFSYQSIDEPLFVIYQADSIVSISGQNILSNFKQLLIPNSHTDSDGKIVNSPDENEEFSVKYIYEHLPDDKTKIYELKRNSQACFILLYLKTYLMRAFGIKKEKVSEYSPSEPVNVYEKSIIRRNIPIFSPDSVLNELTQSQQLQGNNDLKRKLSEDFHRFYEMLLCVQEDQKDDVDSAVPASE